MSYDLDRLIDDSDENDSRGIPITGVDNELLRAMISVIHSAQKMKDIPNNGTELSEATELMYMRLERLESL